MRFREIDSGFSRAIHTICTISHDICLKWPVLIGWTLVLKGKAAIFSEIGLIFHEIQSTYLHEMQPFPQEMTGLPY